LSAYALRSASVIWLIGLGGFTSTKGSRAMTISLWTIGAYALDVVLRTRRQHIEHRAGGRNG
jgi:hypothetical protein